VPFALIAVPKSVSVGQPRGELRLYAGQPRGAQRFFAVIFL